MDTKDALVIGGLLINFIGVLFAVFSSRIKIERRLTRMETMVSIIVRNCSKCKDGNIRSTDFETSQLEHSSDAP